MIKHVGQYRDDLKFWCSALYDEGHIFLHHFVFFISLGLPLTKTSYTKWRNECSTNEMEVGTFVHLTAGGARRGR